MDNLQKYYMERLEFALEAVAHGDLRTCLNICFELRLKSDLALFTRAYVNVTLANNTHIQIYPDKGKFAAEALRIVRELKADKDVGNDATWRASYDHLETMAAELVEVARREVEELEKAWQKKSTRTSMVGKDSQDLVFKDNETGVSVRMRLLDASDDEDAGYTQPWNIEGAFSVFPTVDPTIEKLVGGSTVSSDDEKQDELPELPTIPSRDKSKSRGGAHSDGKSGLLTPAPSSDMDTD